jgi:mannose-6-phosphate isomerase-like protein (cupin superfamily)
MSAVSVMLSTVLVLWLAMAAQTIPPPGQTAPPPPKPTPPTQTVPPPKPQTPPPTTQTPPAPKPQTPTKPAASITTSKPGVLELSATTMVGMTIPNATVRAEGPTTRMGTTGPDGRIVFDNMPAGTYRVRIERESFITLEKEIAVWAGGRTPAQAVLSAGMSTPASPPPSAPAPTPTVAAPVLKPGEPRILSLTDIAEQLLRETDPIAERALGCSGATSSRLIRVRESVASHTHADADELLYIVAGDATLKLGDKEQNISPGWFSMVPRGMAHTITRRGRNPILILSSMSGPACQ